jgi:hypothetical protein
VYRIKFARGEKVEYSDIFYRFASGTVQANEKKLEDTLNAVFPNQVEKQEQETYLERRIRVMNLLQDQ